MSRGLLLAALLPLAACRSVPRNDADWYRDLMLFVAQGRNKAALELMDRVVVEKPDNAWAWANRGTVLLNLRRPDDAAESYGRAMRIEPGSPYLMTCVATAAFRRGRLLDSVDWADKALAVDPKFAAAMAQKAQAFKYLDRKAESDALFKRAFQIDASLKEQFEQ